MIPTEKGYQLSHALIAFGRGEWLGVGLGGSVEKLFYLPEAHTDFLLAVIAEELGFVGCCTVVTLFAWLVIRAFVIGRQAAVRERHFPALLAQGIGVWLGRAGIHQHGREHGCAADKRIDTAADEFRRQQYRRQLHYAGGAAARGLGEQAVDERLCGIGEQRQKKVAKRKLCTQCGYKDRMT